MLKLSSILFLTFLGTETKVSQSDLYKEVRDSMVENQIITRGIKDLRVVEAMKAVPRHLFVSKNLRHLAYDDSPLPIGYNQTISQPFIVAFMVEAAEITSESRILEIGTGCGYQAAILGQLGKEVYSIEIIKPLADKASQTLKKQGYQNVHVRYANGWEGWPEAAPFDVIVMTAASERVPQALLAQLKMGGRFIAPFGKTYSQTLVKYTKTENGLKEEILIPVRFVPMTGKAQGN